MYNQSEPRTEPPEDMDDYREAQSGILAANQKIRVLSVNGYPWKHDEEASDV